ncbi:MAG: hypothetical protein JNL98_08285, partial [Bryobacterales bacterium]|nr:hypothetical protein [Bryobacterales bacterium]
MAGPFAYEYTSAGRQTLLIPPNAATPQQGELRLRVPKMKPQQRTGCDMKGEYVRLSWQGKQANLSMPVDQGVEGTRTPLALLDEINALRALVRTCLKDSDASRFMTGLVEGMALPPATVFYFRYGSSPNAGYVDIDPPLRMKVTTPIRDAQAKITGFEYVYYEMRPRGGGNGYVPRIEHVDTVIGGKPVTRKPGNNLKLPANMNYYRLFFLTRRSPKDHDILLVGSRTEEALASSTQKIKAEGEQACANLAGDVTCIQVPID